MRGDPTPVSIFRILESCPDPMSLGGGRTPRLSILWPFFGVGHRDSQNLSTRYLRPSLVENDLRSQGPFVSNQRFKKPQNWVTFFKRSFGIPL